jgi:DNA helicase HerA-like ATPase
MRSTPARRARSRRRPHTLTPSHHPQKERRDRMTTRKNLEELEDLEHLISHSRHAIDDLLKVRKHLEQSLWILTTGSDLPPPTLQAVENFAEMGQTVPTHEEIGAADRSVRHWITCIDHMLQFYREGQENLEKMHRHIAEGEDLA